MTINNTSTVILKQCESKLRQGSVLKEMLTNITEFNLFCQNFGANADWQSCLWLR